MSDHDTPLLTYLHLAKLSKERKQLPGCDRFLVLAAAEACRAGFPEVAERCRELVLAHNGEHLLSRWPTMPDALRDEEFAFFLKQLEKFCSFEKGEHLLAELEVEAPGGEGSDIGSEALRVLNVETWEDAH